jgi:hypothetical protein
MCAVRCCTELGACAPLIPAEQGGIVDMCAVAGWECNAEGMVRTMNATGVWSWVAFKAWPAFCWDAPLTLKM